MPFWREYRDENNEYVPYKEAEAKAKESGKRVSELYTVVEVMQPEYPDNYSFSVKGLFRGESKEYREGAENREISFEELVDGTETKVRKKK